MTRQKMKFLILTFPITLIILLFYSSGWAVENSECMDCHSDDSLERSESEGMKETLFVDDNKFKISVHNINEIGCIDCHSDIEELNYDNEVPHNVTLAQVNCGGCHEDEEEAYQNSVHKKAGGKGINIPCYACHGYHYVTYLEANSVYERENGFCLKCHNPGNYHDWLTQKDTHFAFVECTVCHALEAPRYVALRFYDLIKNKFLDGDDLLEGLNTDYDGFMPLVDRNNDETIDIEEFENMVLLLHQKNVIGTFHGELRVEIVPTVHQVNRGQANRECEQCHNPNSPFFQEVEICLSKDDGTTDRHKVDRKVLESYYVNHFYALGGTRVRLLDQIGLLLIAGGIAVAGCHLTVRILTAPIRRRRREKEGDSH